MGDPPTAAVLVPEEFPIVVVLGGPVAPPHTVASACYWNFNHGPPTENNLEPHDERSVISTDSTSSNSIHLSGSETRRSEPYISSISPPSMFSLDGQNDRTDRILQHFIRRYPILANHYYLYRLDDDLRVVYRKNYHHG